MDKQDEVDNLNVELAHLLKQEVQKLQFGFMTNNCETSLLSIIIHCVENVEIFTETQFNKLTHYTNKLLYGRGVV